MIGRVGRSTSGARYLALGDSYTIGESVTEREAWPAQLVAGLRAQRIPVDEVQVIARTGWTTEELSRALTTAAPRAPFDLVTLLVGVNDQYRGSPLAGYRTGFPALLGRAIQLAANRAGRMIVLSIPDWGVTPFAAGRDRAAIAREIDAFNQVNRAASTAAGAAYVDVTPVSRRVVREPVLLAPDGLHPSGAMYREWARLVLPVAARALRT